MRIELPLSIVLRAVAVAAALFVLGGCGELTPGATPTINDKIAWSGYVFDEREPAAVASHVTEDEARRLVAGYDPSLEIVALHAGELAPNIGGASYLGYVVEVVRADRNDILPILINAEQGSVAGGPGVDTSDGGQHQ